MLTPEARNLFNFAPRAIYLNHGGAGVAPRGVMEARAKRLTEIEANPHQFLGHELPEAKQKITESVAKRFSMRKENLALVDNVTDGLNAVLRSLRFAPGDEIMITSLTYGAYKLVAAYAAARWGVKIVPVELRFPDPEPAQIIEAIRKAITPRTKLAIFDHVTSGTALILPIAEMTKVCRERGVAVFVDGAHVPGHIAFDVEALGADWYAANLHKWHFVPRSCGFLWAAPQRQADLMPVVLSWDIEKPFPYNFEWTGTRDPTCWLSIPDAFAFMDRLGEDKVRRHNQELLRQALTLLADAWGVRVTTPDSMTGSMSLIPLPEGLTGADDPEGNERIEQNLWNDHRIATKAVFIGQRMWLRVSAQIYNGIEDYERLAKAVNQMRR